MGFLRRWTFNSSRPAFISPDFQSNGVVKKDPLTYKESLRILEHLYELTMHIDSHRRTVPAETDTTMTAIW